jgi:glycosyltransferase involved in cell wall biosynthesis
MDGSGFGRRLRVLMLSRSYPSYAFPSLGLWVERPTALLNKRRDVEVRVVSPQPYCPPLPDVGPMRQYVRFRPIAQQEVLNGVELLRPRFLTGPGRSTYGVESRAYELGVRKTVDRLRESFAFDVIHAHFVYPEGAVAHRLGRRYGVPFVVSEHAPWTSGWFGHRAVRRESLAAGRAAASLMAVSKYIRRSIADWVEVDGRVAVVPEGVDGEMFNRGGRSQCEPDRILFVGWLNFNKGVDVLLRAMELIATRGDPGRLLLVGGSYYRDTRMQERKLRALAASLDLGDRVTFAGPCPHKDVARLMAEAAVVVLPSRAEAFGTVLAEALACGTPVVSTRCGGPEDYVTSEVGALVPVDDPVRLSEALVCVLRERARFDSEHLRRYALERFAWPRIVDRWLDAYGLALGRPLGVLSQAEG